MEILDGIDVENDDGTEGDVLREPNGMEKITLLNKVLDNLSHRFSGIYALEDVRSKAAIPCTDG